MTCSNEVIRRPGWGTWLAAAMMMLGLYPPAGASDARSANGHDDGKIDPRIDAILTKLEQRGDSLRDLQCKVIFVEDDRMNLTKRKKYGRILFLQDDDVQYFLIHFEKSEVDGVLGKQEWYLFDGRWLYQAIERLEQVTKQEQAPPGEHVDLFDLESAPFPLPFGQKKETILRSFDVTLAEPAPDDPPETDHLVCKPKRGSRMYDKYEKLEFFVRRDIHLPSRIVVTKGDGLETDRADFPDLGADSINSGLTKNDFAHPKAWAQYKLVVERRQP